MQTLEHHPIADIMPMMSETEFRRHKESIKRHGQREPIVLHEGKILDGRNTYKACLELGEVPIMREFGSVASDGDSPTAFVVTRNIDRRHLSVSQAAACATAALAFFQAEAKARSEATRFGKKQEAAAATVNLRSPSESEKGTAAAKAAAAFGVSESSVEKAAKLKREAPAKFEEVAAGKKTLHKATQEAAAEKSLPDDDPTKHLRNAHEKEIKELLGEEFAKAFMRGRILKTTGDIEDFLTLDPPDRKAIAELVIRGWTTKKAKKFIDGDLDRTNKIEDAILKLNATGKKKLILDIEGKFRLTIERKAL